MPILKVANIYFNQAGTSAFQYNNDNVVRFVANSFSFPSGTTLNRPTGTELNAGQIRYNSTLGATEFYTGSSWENVATQSAVTAAFNRANSIDQVTGTANVANGSVIIRAYFAPALWTKTANLKSIRVSVVGGGGGSGVAVAPYGTSGGGGGGGVGIVSKLSPAIPGPINITVGAGGTAGNPATPGPGNKPPGGTGGTTSFGTIVSATGGGGGGGYTSGSYPAGAGGTATGADINLSGEAGLVGAGANQGNNNTVSQGGRNFYSSTAAIGQPGRLYGGGAASDVAQSLGNSPINDANPGLAGSTGLVLVEEYY